MNVETRDQGFPAFFAEAPTLTVRDPLALFLGAASQGLIEYRYSDVVRLAGHSCPTVAGAYLMVLNGLRALHGSELPVRGEIEVSMAGAADSGVTGVIASVAQLLTGAAAETGFQGIGMGRRFARQGLLKFAEPVDGELGLRRRDTGSAVQVRLDASVVPWDAEMRPLMLRAVMGSASPEELERFGQLWQERVRRMLIEHATDPRMIQVTAWHRA